MEVVSNAAFSFIHSWISVLSTLRCRNLPYYNCFDRYVMQSFPVPRSPLPILFHPISTAHAFGYPPYVCPCCLYTMHVCPARYLITNDNETQEISLAVRWVMYSSPSKPSTVCYTYAHVKTIQFFWSFYYFRNDSQSISASTLCSTFFFLVPAGIGGGDLYVRLCVPPPPAFDFEYRV